MYVMFDEPVELSMMRIWNYSKTPSRGVRDIAVCISVLFVLFDCCCIIHYLAVRLLSSSSPAMLLIKLYYTVLYSHLISTCPRPSLIFCLIDIHAAAPHRPYHAMAIPIDNRILIYLDIRPPINQPYKMLPLEVESARHFDLNITQWELPFVMRHLNSQSRHCRLDEMCVRRAGL